MMRAISLISPEILVRDDESMLKPKGPRIIPTNNIPMMYGKWIFLNTLLDSNPNKMMRAKLNNIKLFLYIDIKKDATAKYAEVIS